MNTYNNQTSGFLCYLILSSYINHMILFSWCWLFLKSRPNHITLPLISPSIPPTSEVCWCFYRQLIKLESNRCISVSRTHSSGSLGLEEEEAFKEEEEVKRVDGWSSSSSFLPSAEIWTLSRSCPRPELWTRARWTSTVRPAEPCWSEAAVCCSPLSVSLSVMDTTSPKHVTSWETSWLCCSTAQQAESFRVEHHLCCQTPVEVPDQ